MPPLVHALLFRLFGTKQLAAESVLVVSSFLLLLGLVPYLIQAAVLGFIGGAYLVGIYAFIGLFAGIIPGLLIALIGFPALICLLILFLRGCVHITIRYLNWARRKYYLAREDVYLNGLFAHYD